jgi:hypothetical protein
MALVRFGPQVPNVPLFMEVHAGLCSLLVSPDWSAASTQRA